MMLADSTLIQMDLASVTAACAILGPSLAGAIGYATKLFFGYLKERDEAKNQLFASLADQMGSLSLKLTDVVEEIEKVDVANRASQQATTDRLISVLVNNTQATAALTAEIQQSRSKP